jgi:hypothetical protein
MVGVADHACGKIRFVGQTCVSFRMGGFRISGEQLPGRLDDDMMAARITIQPTSSCDPSFQSIVPFLMPIPTFHTAHAFFSAWFFRKIHMIRGKEKKERGKEEKRKKEEERKKKSCLIFPSNKPGRHLSQHPQNRCSRRVSSTCSFVFIGGMPFAPPPI